MSTRHCLSLDLKDDPATIQEYDDWHARVWPEVLESLTAAGIVNMQIYRIINRLFMIIETDDSFSFERKAAMDAANPKVQAWEAMMAQLQQPLPGSAPGEKWKLMTKVFELQQP
ncbi:MAG: L-rhamnose mutarotase [Ferruginibacter sp.]